MNPVLVEGRFERREKRFFSYCVLPDGSPVVAHCPNPGSMKGNKEPGSRVWLMDFGPDHGKSGRKLRYKWVMVESQGVRVVIDTGCANAIVAQALRKGLIPELPGDFRAEHKVGDSRLDFFSPGPPATYVEVKSVSMGEGALSAFPDSVTERGQKHLRELMALRAAGHRAVLFFLVMRENSLRVRAAGEIDPEYARLLSEAVAEGVEVLVYGISILPDGSLTLGARGSLELS